MEQSLLRLRILVPWIILAGFVVDGGLRLLFPPERIAYRGWEAAGAFPTTIGPFAPNLVYRNEHSYGDLANLGNLPLLRHYHPDVFTTDKWGFRRTPQDENTPMSMLFLGDSFTVGAALCDSDTLSAQVSHLGHIGTYNGGGEGGLGLIETLIKRINLTNGVVVYEQSERYEVPDPPNVDKGAASSMSVRNSTESFWRIRMVKRMVSGLARYSPLQVFLTRPFLAIENDYWLPNLAAKGIVQQKLKDGETFLFLTSEKDNVDRVRDVRVGYFAELQKLVRSTGNELLVILVPDKFNVYRPLFEGDESKSDGDNHGDAKPAYLEMLANNLTEAKVPVLNLTQALRDQAADVLPQGKYNYYADDTHWNPLGVSKAAELILRSQRH